MAEFVGRLSQGSNTKSPTDSKFVGRFADTKIEPKGPTLGGQILRGIVSPVATLLARPIQAAQAVSGQEIEDINKRYADKFKGYVAPIEVGGKGILKDVGRGIETVALGLPIVKSTKLFSTKVPALSTSIGGKVLGNSKLTTTAIKKAKVIGNVGADVATGAVFGTGLGLEKGEDLGGVIKEASLGGITSGIGGQIIRGIGSKLGKKGVPQVLDETLNTSDNIATNQIEEIIPSKLSPKDKMAVYSQKMGYEPYIPDEQLPTIQAGNIPKSGLPTIQVGEKPPKKVKGDFTYEPIVEPKPIQPKPVIEQVIPEVNTAKVTPEIKTNVVNPKQTISVLEDVVRNTDENLGDDFVRQKSTEYFNRLQKYSPEEILGALNKGESLDGMPKEALSSFLAKHADDTGDLALSKKVRRQMFAEKGGQEAQARTLSKGTTADITRDIIKGRAKTQGINLQKTESEVKNLTKDLTNKVKQVIESSKKNVSVTREQVKEIIKDLMC